MLHSPLNARVVHPGACRCRRGCQPLPVLRNRRAHRSVACGLCHLIFVLSPRSAAFPLRRDRRDHELAAPSRHRIGHLSAVSGAWGFKGGSMLKGELRERTGLPGIWRAWAERDRHRRELITMHASSLGDLALPQSLVADEVRRWPWEKDSAQWRASAEARMQCPVGKPRDMPLLRDPDLTDMTKLFAAACREFSARPAYRVGPKWINYAECQTRGSSIAAALSDVLSDHRRTSGKQPVIAVLLPNNYVVLESFFAAALTYAIVLPINHRLTAPEIATALQVSGAVILVTSNAFSNVLAEIAWGDLPVRTVARASDPVDLPVRDQRWWETLVSHPVSSRAFSDKEPARYLQGFSTSGTTGKTKTVLHTHRNEQAHTLATIEALGLTAEDNHCWAHIGPMFHVGDAVFVWIAALWGARHVFHEKQFEVADVARLLATERVTIVKLVPSMLRLMCASENIAAYNFQALRWILT